MSESQEVINAQLLREALNHMISDKKGIIQVLGKMPNDLCVPTLNTFNTTFSRDLLSDIKSKTSSDFERVCLALTTEVNEFDCKCIRLAVQGMGTNEDLCTEILCTRNDEELKAISAVYQRMHSKVLKERMTHETSGNLKSIYVTVLSGRASQADIKSCVQQLYAAGEDKIGTDEKTFIAILAGHTREVVTQIAQAYVQAHGKTLYKVIGSEFSGHVKYALQTLVQPVPQFYAELFKDKITKMNVDEVAVIRIIRARKEKDLVAISAALQAMKNGKPMIQWVVEKTGNNLKRMLVAVCASFAGTAAL